VVRMETRTALFLNAVCEFLDNGIREDFAGDSFDLGTGRIGSEAISQRKSEILALANRGNVRKADLAEGILDGLALWIEDRCLQSDIDMRLHYP